MREMVYVAAINNFEFKAVHVARKSNLLPDLLSRWHEGQHIRNKFNELVQNSLTRVHCDNTVFQFMHEW